MNQNDLINKINEIKANTFDNEIKTLLDCYIRGANRIVSLWRFVQNTKPDARLIFANIDGNFGFKITGQGFLYLDIGEAEWDTAYEPSSERVQSEGYDTAYEWFERKVIAGTCAPSSTPNLPPPATVAPPTPHKPKVDPIKECEPDVVDDWRALTNPTQIMKHFPDKPTADDILDLLDRNKAWGSPLIEEFVRKVSAKMRSTVRR